jgi:hypothetical protein
MKLEKIIGNCELEKKIIGLSTSNNNINFETLFRRGKQKLLPEIKA